MDAWHDMIRQMKAWIDESIEDGPSLTDLAKRLGYSYFYAAKKFREIEGISYREYVLRYRIRQAAHALYTTSDKTIDVAVKYGYSSQEAFTRAFVRVFGVTPWAYRRLQKPTAMAQKSAMLSRSGTLPEYYTKGSAPMKIYVKQMYDWNCYAYYAEDVDEKYWGYFRSELWWQLGNSFIKQYDNVADFEYCAKNFTQYGEIAIQQQLKMIPAPWERALDLFATRMASLDVDWFVHGSTAMALWGIDVAPKDVDIIVANCSDFDKVRSHLYPLAIKPIERCSDWVMSGGGNIFMEATIGVWFYNKELEPYDIRRHEIISHNGRDIYVASLADLKQANENFNRPERVALIQRRMAQEPGAI